MIDFDIAGILDDLATDLDEAAKAFPETNEATQIILQVAEHLRTVADTIDPPTVSRNVR